MVAHRRAGGRVTAPRTRPEAPTSTDGVGESGFRRIHDGLRELTRAKSISRQRFRSPVALCSFERPRGAAQRLASLLRLRHGRR